MIDTLLPARRRKASAGALAVAAFVLAGCQSYERDPLDLAATREAWMGHSPGDESVRQFADRLARAEGADTAVFDPSDGLTLGEAEPVALVFNRDLRLSRLEANVTRATSENAGLWEDPVAGVDIERIVSGVSDPWVIAGTVGLTLPISGRLEVEKERAGAAYAAELQRLAAREWATRAALRELWVEWSEQVLRVRMATHLVDRLRVIVELAQRQERAGVMSRIDARLFRVELVGSEAELIAMRARAKELELQVRDMMGIAPEAPIQFIESISFAGRAAGAAWSLDTIETSNLELAAVRTEYEVAEQTLRLEVRKQYPDLEIGPGYGTDQGDERVLLGIRLPIPLWNRNRQGVAEAAASREAARGRFENTYEHLASRLAIAQTRYEAGRSMREAIEAQVLPLADEQDAEVQRVAELGRVDPLLLLQTIKSQYDAKVRLLDARGIEAIGAIRLDELIGPPSPPPSPDDSDRSTDSQTDASSIQGGRP